MEKPKFTGTKKKSKAGEEQSQVHAYHILWRQGTVHKEFFLAGQNSQFHILLWRFMVTAWKCVKTSPWTLATKELAVASRTT
jgi:hypothetical protein